ncbi:MAG: hypothetical protein HYV33_05010 [Candidatus Kerfeldbacteria bacterium]|nr:hypothetical protein [Candidatus Kerfeldbacteria bacterium]
MVIFVFSKFAEKRLRKLGRSEQDRVITKLQEFKSHPDIFSILKPLHNFEPASHRLRIGNYRLILQLTKASSQQVEFFVLDVGHRRDIYQ